jgi:putative transferase (TIGR04331 family)
MRALAPFLRGVAWLKRRQKYFFTSTYLHKIDKIWLEFSLCQMTLPNLTSSSSKIQTQSKYELMQRDWKLPLSPSEDAFGTIVRKLLPTFLPRIFLEGYVELASQVDRLPWPKAPKVIFTSNQHFSDDLFKAWAASKVTQGGKLVIGEHGGMGTNLFNASHSYQLAISNRFISTGWLDSECAHVTPVGNFRWNQRKISPKPVGKALLVCGIMPRYAFDIRSMMLSSQVTGYFEDQFDFVGTLPEALRGQLLVRITPTDYGWDQEGRWYERYPCVKLDRGTRPMWDVASECRLFIATYNATTYIDSLTLNFPTIIFWNSDRWEVKMEAKPYFEKLKSVGIFHETPTSAAIQIASIWNDVDAWWSSAPVQKARLEFCAIYSATPNDLLSRIRSILIEEANCANYVV